MSVLVIDVGQLTRFSWDSRWHQPVSNRISELGEKRVKVDNYERVSVGTIGNCSVSSSPERLLRPAQVGAGTAAKLLAGTQVTMDPTVVTVDEIVNVAVFTKGLLMVELPKNRPPFCCC